MYFLYRLEMCNFMHYWSVCVYSVATGNTVDVNLHKYFLASAQHLCRKQALDEAHVQNYQGHEYFFLDSNCVMQLKSTKPLGMQASIFGACPKPG